MSAATIGSTEHKRLFCRTFLDTYDAYEVGAIRWPDLGADDLDRLRALPFWGEAIRSERVAAVRVANMVDAEPDREIRDAIALQAHEEARHAELVQSLLDHCGITVPDAPPEPLRDPEWGFLRMGYGECFDSFFAFGLFRFAADAGVFPRPLVERFDGVMQEEARHILFFTNWIAYRRIQLPYHHKARFLVRRGLSASRQALDRMRTAVELRRADRAEHLGREAGDDFTMQVPQSIGDVTLRELAETCLRENERRLAPYDEGLLRPRFVPTIVQGLLQMVVGRPGAPAD